MVLCGSCTKFLCRRLIPLLFTVLYPGNYENFLSRRYYNFLFLKYIWDPSNLRHSPWRGSRIPLRPNPSVLLPLFVTRICFLSFLVTRFCFLFLVHLYDKILMNCNDAFWCICLRVHPQSSSPELRLLVFHNFSDFNLYAA